MSSSSERIGQLYPRAAPLIYRRARALLGEEDQALDAVQDIFLVLHRDLGSFRGEASLLTWIYRVTTNHCLNRLRDRRTELRALRLFAEGGQRGDGNEMRRLERRDLLRHLLGRFDERKVQILVHQHYDGMTQAEIGQVMGISERAVRKALQKINERLDRELGEALGALQEEL